MYSHESSPYGPVPDVSRPPPLLLSRSAGNAVTDRYLCPDTPPLQHAGDVTTYPAGLGQKDAERQRNSKGRLLQGTGA